MTSAPKRTSKKTTKTADTEPALPADPLAYIGTVPNFNLHAVAELYGVPARAIRNVIAPLVDDGTLINLGHGNFQWPE